MIEFEKDVIHVSWKRIIASSHTVISYVSLNVFEQLPSPVLPMKNCEKYDFACFPGRLGTDDIMSWHDAEILDLTWPDVSADLTFVHHW